MKMNTKKNLSIVIVKETESAVIAQVTKSFEKNSKIFGTEEYKLWREFKRDCPSAVMTTKKIKRNPNKRTNKNLTYKNMRTYIAQQSNAEELMEQFERELKLSKIQSNPYRAVLAWFEQTFEGYDGYKAYFEKLADEAREKEAEELVA